jgi:NAD(P)-dependent dehydrogenase (short-subunit alcohol dehydrogenase family)
MKRAQCDVTSPESVQALADKAWQEFSSVDVLCNNAGVVLRVPWTVSTIDDWRWVIEVNLFGVVHGLHAFVPRMREQGTGGHIVNTASFGGLVAGMHDGLGSYIASKYAVVGISEQLKTELAEDGIGVSVICPTGMPTQINAAERNRPGGPLAEPLDNEDSARLAARQQAGMDPAVVADMTIDAVRGNRLYVINSAEYRSLLLDRFGTIIEAFASSAD